MCSGSVARAGWQHLAQRNDHHLGATGEQNSAYEQLQPLNREESFSFSPFLLHLGGHLVWPLDDYGPEI